VRTLAGLAHAVIALLLATCTSYVAPVTATLEQFAFLQPGRTTRDEVLARLGTPSVTYEDGRIASYPIYRTKSGQLTASSAATEYARPGLYARPHGGPDRPYTLMLVYDRAGTLERQSLVDDHE
jgi:outer membrane protein assembly factor BamE (lipoprotein component of BamABCDE complex)